MSLLLQVKRLFPGRFDYDVQAKARAFSKDDDRPAHPPGLAHAFQLNTAQRCVIGAAMPASIWVTSFSSLPLSGQSERRRMPGNYLFVDCWRIDQFNGQSYGCRWYSVDA